jgi:hypothetical protein
MQFHKRWFLCCPEYDTIIYLRLDEVIGYFNWPNPSSHIMALGPTQPLTGMSTSNLPGGKGGPVHKADNLTAICEPIV